MTISQKKIAFTLAEVLITLGIIGVVCAMTIPTLMHNTQQAELKTAFKKAYSTASQAWLMAVTENPGTYVEKGGWYGISCAFPDGTTSDVNTGADGRVDAFKSKMQVIKSCVAQTGCWPDNCEQNAGIPGDNLGNGFGGATRYSWVTSDGMNWTAPWYGMDEAEIFVDTNGNKKPNKIGQDILGFLLGVDGVVYFIIDDMSTTGKPVSSGLVCPFQADPGSINGRSVSFKNWLN